MSAANKRLSELTTAARAGYDGNANPYLYSSPMWYAHSLGRYLHDTGRTPPRDVRPGRGSRMHANDLQWIHSDNTGWARI